LLLQLLQGRVVALLMLPRVGGWATTAAAVTTTTRRSCVLSCAPLLPGALQLLAVLLLWKLAVLLLLWVVAALLLRWVAVVLLLLLPWRGPGGSWRMCLLHLSCLMLLCIRLPLLLLMLWFAALPAALWLQYLWGRLLVLLLWFAALPALLLLLLLLWLRSLQEWLKLLLLVLLKLAPRVWQHVAWSCQGPGRGTCKVCIGAGAAFSASGRLWTVFWGVVFIAAASRCQGRGMWGGCSCWLQHSKRNSRMVQPGRIVHATVRTCC
jgi:hypothetical protein